MIAVNPAPDLYQSSRRLQEKIESQSGRFVLARPLWLSPSARSLACGYLPIVWICGAY